MSKKVRLHWKKRRDPHGTPIDLIAKNGKDIWQVVFAGKKGKEPCALTLNGLVQFRGSKADCKHTAGRLLRDQGKRSEVKKMTPEEKRRKEVVDTYAALEWHFGPDFHLIHPKKNRLLKQAGIRRKELTPTVIRTAEHNNRELGTICRQMRLTDPDRPATPVLPATVTIKPRKCKPPKKKERPADKPRTRLAERDRVQALSYSGPPAQERDRSKRRVTHAPTTDTPCPFKPKSTKSFKRIRQWAEKVRDHFEEKRLFASVYYLARALAMIYKDDHEKERRAGDKLRAIFREEFELERQHILGMVQKAEAVQEDITGVKKEGGPKGKDKWGYRLSSRASKVNLTITDKGKSTQEIEKEIGDTGIASHLGTLRRKKLIVKTKSGKWRLPR